jgi:hypothetical protein
MLLDLYFSKAFDSLEWDFMFSTLKHYGFNYSFVTWVETLYNNIQTCVINNGWISSLQFFSLPIHMPSVLFLFRINPENDPNISISFMAKAISVLELTNNVVSSAYRLFKHL